MTFYYVYILCSLKNDYIYIGFTENLKRRFKEHNSKLNVSTKHYAPFELIHYEAYRNKKKAKRREEYLKTNKEKNYFKNYVKETLKEV